MLKWAVQGRPINEGHLKMHPNKANFIEGLSIVMKRWTALQLAVEMDWGGPYSSEKAKDFEESLADYFEKEGKKLEPEDIEDILYDVMRDEFGTILEDESEIEVAKQMYQLFSESIKGQTAFLDSLKKKRVDRSQIIDASKMQMQTEEMDSGAEMNEEMDEDLYSVDED